jgi:hypothetical protein
MICAPADLPAIFVTAVIPAGPIPEQAAEAVAQLLLDAVDQAKQVRRQRDRLLETARSCGVAGGCDQGEEKTGDRQREVKP